MCQESKEIIIDNSLYLKIICPVCGSQYLNILNEENEFEDNDNDRFEFICDECNNKIYFSFKEYKDDTYDVMSIERFNKWWQDGLASIDSSKDDDLCVFSITEEDAILRSIDSTWPADEEALNEWGKYTVTNNLLLIQEKEEILTEEEYEQINENSKNDYMLCDNCGLAYMDKDNCRIDSEIGNCICVNCKLNRQEIW